MPCLQYLSPSLLLPYQHPDSLRLHVSLAHSPPVGWGFGIPACDAHTQGRVSCEGLGGVRRVGPDAGGGWRAQLEPMRRARQALAERYERAHLGALERPTLTGGFEKAAGETEAVKERPKL